MPLSPLVPLLLPLLLPHVGPLQLLPACPLLPLSLLPGLVLPAMVPEQRFPWQASLMPRLTMNQCSLMELDSSLEW